MGNSDSRLYKAPTLKHQSWREGTIQRQTKAEQGRYRVLVNKLTSEELEEYLLAFHSLAEFQRYLQFFQWREREDSVVNAKYLNYKLGSDFCATSYTASVYIQRIPVRLSDIEDIPFPQNLYLLLTALDGFEKLYRIVGYFRPTEDLICMDRDGRVKAWLHSDLSCSLPAGCPPEEAGLRRQETLEARMVQEIVRLVEDNTSHDPEQPLTVTDYLRRNHRTRPLTFKQAREDILSYAQQLHADIPNYFESVVGIFDQEPSHNDEHSAQPPSSLHNPQSSHPNAEQLEFRGNVEHWNLNEPISQHLEERPTEKGSEHSRERVNAAPPMQNYMRPNTVAYSLVNPPSHYPPYQQYRPQPMSSVSASSPKVLFNYQPQQQPLPPPPLFLPYNIQSLPLQHLPTPQPHQNYINPVSPISQLASPALVIKKATSVQPQESDRTHPQQKFDAKLVLSSSLKHLLSANNRLVYSDSTSTYQLDEELAEDMVKYLTET